MRKCFSGNDLDAVQLAALPPMMRDLAREIGLAAVLALADLHGGRRTFVPLGPGGKTYARLAEAMGKDAAGKFARIYARENIFIPKCGAASRALRDAEICRDAAAGASYSALSRRFDLTERQISNILRRGRGRRP